MIYSHTPVEFYFNKNADNFFVEEIPLYSYMHTGEWLMLKIRKKNITTIEMIKKIARFLNIPLDMIGYAQLKDKDALSVQWISIPRKYRNEINKFSDKDIKILEQDLHRNKLKTGHLKSNKFFVRLKKVNLMSAKILLSILKDIQEYGIPNFFGEQMVNTYQAKLFNDWLKERIKLSSVFELNEKELLNAGYKKDFIKFIKMQKHPFKLLLGDVMSHYPVGRLFYFEQNESERFFKKEISPTGLLPGKKVLRAKDKSKEIEKKYDEAIPAGGDRRIAWIFPEIVDKKYNKDKAWFELSFILPKGSYATVLIDLLKNGLKGF